MSERIRVLIADHDGATRAGVRLALAPHGFEVCAEAATATAAVHAAASEQPDVCVIEVDLPGGGLAALDPLFASAPQTRVVMLSRAADDDQLFAAVRAGARGYLLKDMDPARLPMALRGVLDGEAAVPRALMGRVLDELRAVENGRHASELSRLGVDLTPREQEVLDALDRGLATAQMATALGISTVTVRRHISEILRKLGAPNRQAALDLLHAP